MSIEVDNKVNSIEVDIKLITKLCSALRAKVRNSYIEIGFMSSYRKDTIFIVYILIFFGLCG